MFVALLSVMLLASEPVATTTSPPAPAQAPAARETASAPTTPQSTAGGETAQEPKKICRRQSAITGQVRAKRVCLTAEQWKQAK